MRAENSRPSPFREHLNRTIAAGQIGRHEIVSRLATMPIEKLKDVPADILSLLGPRGLAELAQRHSDLAALSPPPRTRDSVVPPMSHGNRVRLRNNPAPTLALAAILVLGGLAIDLGRVAFADWIQPIVRPVSTASWPICPKLDRRTDGCLYKTGSNGLTIARAAAILGIDAEKLVSINSHLATTSTAALPAGSRIVVWRGTGRLGKGNQQ